VAEQRLFLDMMQSCGICFVHRRGPYGDGDATEYIAPDLLPERSAVQDELDAMWDAVRATESEDFDFEMLHSGLARGLICEIGREAGVAALYWRGGVCAYETTTRSHVLIEQHDMQDAWRGRIRVQTQGSQSRLLLDRLATWIEQRSGTAAAMRLISAVASASMRRMRGPGRRLNASVSPPTGNASRTRSKR
jgi:internalin A